MTILFVEPLGGMAGDMLLAALLDLGDPRFTLAALRELAETLVPGECRLELREARRGSLRGAHLLVETPESGSAPHRRLADLLELLARAAAEGPLGEAARARAAAVLERIAEAEGRVHGRPAAEVHFHEVGAVDTLVDVAGAALALERLEVERVHASPPLTGSGSVQCAHGEMPVPAPGTAELLRGLPARVGGGEGERLTPTGAALYAELVDVYGPPGAFAAAAIGYGAGTRDPAEGPPNLLRVQLGGSPRRAEPPAPVWLLEFNLDDATGEEVGFCLQELRAAGALEAWWAPVQMKKDRPGGVVTALCREPARPGLERVAFDHTPTLGLRWSPVERTECEREELAIELHGRRVRVVRRRRPGEGSALAAIDLSPEHDDLAALARETGRPLRELEREVVRRLLERPAP